MPSWIDPSDTHSPGDTGHTTDHNHIADDLALIADAFPGVETGQATTAHNTLDDGSGNMTVAGKINGQKPSLAPSGDTTGATDYANIQGLLNLAGNCGLQPGTFYVNNMLQIPSNTSLSGAGKGVTTIKAASGSWSGVAQVNSIDGLGLIITSGNTTASNISVVGITFDGNQTGITAIPGWAVVNGCGGIHLNHVTGLIIRNCQVINSIGYSIYLQSDVNFRVLDCVVTSGQVSAAQGWGTPSQQDGIHLDTCSYGMVDRCNVDTGTTSGVGDDGIALQSYGVTHDITISNCTVRSAAACVDLALSGANIYNVTITGNTFWQSVDAGVVSQPFTGSGAISYNVTISGNTFQNTGTGNAFYCGVALLDYSTFTTAAQGWTDVAITGNTFTGLTQGADCVIYARYGKNLAIAGNVISNCQAGMGILVGDTANSGTVSLPVTNFSVTGNTVDISATTYTAFQNGVLVIDSNTGAISGNTVIGSGSASGSIPGLGICIQGIATSPVGITVTGNRCSGWNTTAASSMVIGELNGGAGPDYNNFGDNLLHGSSSTPYKIVGLHTNCQQVPVDAGATPNYETYQVLTSAYTTGGGTTSLQKLVNGTANGYAALQVGTYFFECEFSLSAMSSTAGTFSFGVSGVGATLNNVKWYAECNKTALTSTVSPYTTTGTAAGATVVSPSNTTTTGFGFVRGWFQVTAPGAVLIGFATSVAASTVVGAGSWIRIWPVSNSGSAQYFGNWS